MSLVHENSRPYEVPGNVPNQHSELSVQSVESKTYFFDVESIDHSLAQASPPYNVQKAARRRQEVSGEQRQRQNVNAALQSTAIPSSDLEEKETSLKTGEELSEKPAPARLWQLKNAEKSYPVYQPQHRKPKAKDQVQSRGGKSGQQPSPHNPNSIGIDSIPRGHSLITTNDSLTNNLESVTVSYHDDFDDDQDEERFQANRYVNQVRNRPYAVVKPDKLENDNKGKLAPLQESLNQTSIPSHSSPPGFQAAQPVDTVSPPSKSVTTSHNHNDSSAPSVTIIHQPGVGIRSTIHDSCPSGQSSDSHTNYNPNTPTGSRYAEIFKPGFDNSSPTSGDESSSTASSDNPEQTPSKFIQGKYQSEPVYTAKSISQQQLAMGIKTKDKLKGRGAPGLSDSVEVASKSPSESPQSSSGSKHKRLSSEKSGSKKLESKKPKKKHLNWFLRTKLKYFGDKVGKSHGTQLSLHRMSLEGLPEKNTTKGTEKKSKKQDNAKKLAKSQPKSEPLKTKQSVPKNTEKKKFHFPLLNFRNKADKTGKKEKKEVKTKVSKSDKSDKSLSAKSNENKRKSKSRRSPKHDKTSRKHQTPSDTEGKKVRKSEKQNGLNDKLSTTDLNEIDENMDNIVRRKNQRTSRTQAKHVTHDERGIPHDSSLDLHLYPSRIRVKPKTTSAGRKPEPKLDKSQEDKYEDSGPDNFYPALENDENDNNKPVFSNQKYYDYETAPKKRTDNSKLEPQSSFHWPNYPTQDKSTSQYYKPRHSGNLADEERSNQECETDEYDQGSWVGYGINERGMGDAIVSKLTLNTIAGATPKYTESQKNKPVADKNDKKSPVNSNNREGMLTAYLPKPNRPQGDGRRLFLIRHGERMDRIFPEWIHLSFTDQGRYVPYDMNQPLQIPNRSGGYSEYRNDAPLTKIGEMTSSLVGKALFLKAVRPTRIYASPALRSIQSAQAISSVIEGVPIAVEPGLFEWLDFYPVLPCFMSPESLKSQMGYNIDTTYQPVMDYKELESTHAKEKDIVSLYQRTRRVLKAIVQREALATEIVIVGHACMLDAGPQALHARPSAIPPKSDFMHFGLHYPYNAIVALGEADQKWRIIHNAIPTITYLDYNNRVNTQFFNRNRVQNEGANNLGASDAHTKILLNQTQFNDELDITSSPEINTHSQAILAGRKMQAAAV